MSPTVPARDFGGLMNKLDAVISKVDVKMTSFE